MRLYIDKIDGANVYCMCRRPLSFTCGNSYI